MRTNTLTMHAWYAVVAAVAMSAMFSFKRSNVSATPISEEWQQHDEDGGQQQHQVIAFDSSDEDDVPAATSFLELAKERFNARIQGGSATPREENWTFDHVQLVRVPKAASTEASVLARRLAGCTPYGPCCQFPGDPPGTCPTRGLLCKKVTGCAGHNFGPIERKMLLDPQVFSMANLRDVADRMVSGFFYTPPHSPACAKAPNVNYNKCFREMADTPMFQNVASRMLSGHDAYDGSTRLCIKKRNEAVRPPFRGGCREDLRAVLRGACNLNFVTMCEAWGSSVILLFETVPEMVPTEEHFPAPRPRPAEHHQSTAREVARKINDGGSPPGAFARQNTGKRHEEGIGFISPNLRELARRKNAVDEALHEFVTAKFCYRLLGISDLADHPLVRGELARNERFASRCNNASWVADTLERFEPLAPKDCRLYRPLSHPVI